MRVQKTCLYLSWLLAALAMIGSLYYSEIKHFHPCTLCWYQRICLYPLVIILGVAFFNQRYDVFAYAIGFPGVGIVLSIYHLMVQHIDGFAPLHLCSSAVSCATILDSGVWKITIPMMSFATNVAIFVLLFFTRKKEA